MTIALGSLWIVFDNLHALGRVNEHFEFRDRRNVLVGVAGEDSQFEVKADCAAPWHTADTHAAVQLTHIRFLSCVIRCIFLCH